MRLFRKSQLKPGEQPEVRCLTRAMAKQAANRGRHSHTHHCGCAYQLTSNPVLPAQLGEMSFTQLMLLVLLCRAQGAHGCLQGDSGSG